jgi:hypothetical protein
LASAQTETAQKASNATMMASKTPAAAAPASPGEGQNLIGPALASKAVTAEVVDLDTYRPAYSVGIETDYIICVSTTNGTFESFR